MAIPSNTMFSGMTGMFSPEEQARMKAAAEAQYKANTENLARIRAEGLAQMKQQRDTLRAYRPVAGVARYYDPDSTNYVNPYYIGPDPSPGVYKRFHWESPGSGIQYASGRSFAGSFNDMLSSRWFDEADVSGLSPMMLRSAEMGGGFGYLPYSQAVERGLISDEVQANLAYNKLLRGHQSGYKSFFDQEALDHFKASGIDVENIKSIEDLEAIPTALKGRLFGEMLDVRMRRGQAKNQRPKPFGFGDALGIGLAVASAFVGNPYAAAALGAGGAAASGGDLGDIALAGGIAGFANFAGGKLGEAWDTYRAGQGATTASNVAAFGGTPANVFGQISPDLAVRGLGGTGITAGNLGSTIFNPAALGGIQGATALGTGAALGGTAANIFGALPATGIGVLSALGVKPAVSTSITPGGRIAPFFEPSTSAIRGTTAGATALSSGRGGISALSSEGLGRNIVHSGLSSIANSIRAPSEGGGGMLGKVVDQLPRVPTITYPDYAPVRSGVPIQAGFERTSNIGVPSEYGYVPTGLTPDTALPYGSGLDPYAPTEGPDFDVSPYFQGPKLFHRGGGVVNVDSGARPTDQESFYQTYESGSQQYSDNLGEGMGITYDRVEGTDIPPQSRLQVFETPPMGVGSLNGTARDMFAAGGPVQHFMAGGVAKGLSQMPLFADDVLKALPSTPKVNPVIPVSTSSLYTPLPPYQPELPMGQESIEDPEAEWLDIYHGTLSDTPIEEFDPGKERRGEGISASTNPLFAQAYTPGGAFSPSHLQAVHEQAAGYQDVIVAKPVGEEGKVLSLKLRTKNIFDSRNPRHIDRLISSVEATAELRRDDELEKVALDGLKAYSEELKADYKKAVSRHREVNPFVTNIEDIPTWTLLEHPLIARHIKKLGFEGFITIDPPHVGVGGEQREGQTILKVFPPDPRRTEKEKNQTELLHDLPEDYAEAAKYSSEDALYLKQLEAEQVPLSEALYARDPQWRYPLRSADAAFEYERRQEPGLKLAYGGGVGSLNGTARDMTRYAYGGGVGSLNDTARAMTYAGGGIVRAAAMVWQPFKVKIKNQAIFGEFMGYTKTGKVRVLDQESGVEKLYPKSRVRRAYSDEPLPDEPVKKAVGGPIIKTAAELLKRDPAGFFNKSQLVVQEAKLPQATGQRWQQLFQDKGINKAELGGLGLLTFLGLSRDEPITKEAVAEFIDENRLEVGEDYRASVKSDTEERIDFISTEDPMFGELNLSWPEGSFVKDPSKVGYSVVIDPQATLGFLEDASLEALRNRAVRPANWRLINEDPQRGENSLSWSIADDNNRRISNLTGAPMSLNEAKVKLISQLREQSDDPLVGGPLTPTGGQAPRWQNLILRSPAVDLETELRDSQAAAELLNYREIALTDQQTGGLHKTTRELINKLSEQVSQEFKPYFESWHFPMQTQPGQHNFPENTLVHLRVTDRPVAIDGVYHENVLYPEEIQSDWAQGAIGSGILRSEDISRKAELLDKFGEIPVEPVYQSHASSKIENELDALDQKQAYSSFLESGDKKGSVDQSPVLSLAIRRILREAVDNGQDYVVFSNYKDQATRWGETELSQIYQETIPNLSKKIVRDLGGYVKPKFKTKEKESKYYEQHPDERGKEEDAFFADTVIEPQYAPLTTFLYNTETAAYSHLSGSRFVVHITDAMAKKIREEGQPVLSRAAGGPIIKRAVKTLTKPKKDPLLPAETLMATRPVEPLATTRTGYRVVNVDDAGNLVSQADARVVLPPELGSQHNVPMWLTLDDQYAVENYSHGSFEPGEQRQVLLTYDFNEKDILQGNLTDVETEFSVGRAKLREMRDLYGEASRMQRADEAGFGEVLYHGTDADITKFKDEMLGSSTEHSQSLLGHMVTPKEQIADMFPAGAVTGKNIMPLRVRGKYYEMPIDEYYKIERSTPTGDVRAIKDDLVKQGYDGIEIVAAKSDAHNIGAFTEELGTKIVFDPKNIRSKFAKFDPSKKGSADILAAKGGGVSSLNGIARNMTRYAYGGGVGSMNETARSM